MNRAAIAIAGPTARPIAVAAERLSHFAVRGCGGASHA